MSWLKKADSAADWLASPAVTDKLRKFKEEERAATKQALQKISLELSDLRNDLRAEMHPAHDILGQAKAWVEQAIVSLQQEKEGAVYDDTAYQRNDENQSMNGDFDPQNVDDQRKDTTIDVGPISATPGNTPGVLSPSTIS